MPLEQSERKIAQGGHNVGLGAFGNTGCVFAHADVAPVVRAVFDTIPVPAYGFEQFGRGIVACGYAGYVVGVFFLRFINFSRSQTLPFTVNEDELPAPRGISSAYLKV